MRFIVEHLPTCESTMDEAKRRARDGGPDGTVVVARCMSAGRGRRGHTWYAPEGGLYMSVVLRDLRDPHLLTLALGNAVADVLEVAGAEPRLKWVNDVWIGKRKVAGTLVEVEATGERIDFFVAGIGINVNGTLEGWPDELRGIATTLELELGTETCIEDLEAALLDALDRWIGKVRDGRNEDILAAFRERDLLRGRTVRAGDLEGTAEGVDDSGRLVVAGRPVSSGVVDLLD